MKHIGIISDTHGYWDDKYEYYLGECDEIWHAGDIGSMEVADRFEAMKPIFRAVYGNIDDYDMRARYREILRFKCEDVDVLLKQRTLVRLTIDGNKFTDCEVITLGDKTSRI